MIGPPDARQIVIHALFPALASQVPGRDNRRATKLVVGILRRAGQKDPSPMRSWSTDTDDIRNDPAIAAELAGWLRSRCCSCWNAA